MWGPADDTEDFVSDRTNPRDAGSAADPIDPSRRTLAYHGRTKHHPHRTARSLGFLDWATQPDPFRTFAGAPAVALPLQADGLATSSADWDRPGAVAPRPLDRQG